MSEPHHFTPASVAAALERTRLEPTGLGNCALKEPGHCAMSAREQEIMLLVAEGFSNKQLARQLNITEGTVKIHLHNIFKKADVTNRTALAAFARQNESYIAAK